MLVPDRLTMSLHLRGGLRKLPLSLRRDMNQRRTFLGLQQTPPPNPRMMGYLVAQGFAVVLLVDLGFATLLGHSTITRKVAQSAGVWEEDPPFETHHNTQTGT
jgi:hypothetical protein